MISTIFVFLQQRLVNIDIQKAINENEKNSVKNNNISPTIIDENVQSNKTTDVQSWSTSNFVIIVDIFFFPSLILYV